MAFVLGEPTVQQYFDANGAALANGTIEFYVTGTSTPTAVYSDSSGTSLGTSVTLNSIGAPQNSGGTAVALFFDNTVTYKIIRKDSAGTAIAPTIDPYYPPSTVSGIGGSSGTVATIAALKAVTGQADNNSIVVLGHGTEGDGGGGIFWFDSASSATDDNGLVIQPTAGTGRWIRQWDKHTANTAWWAALTTASAADNTTAIQAGIDSNAPVLRNNPGTYSVNELTINRTIRFDGSGAHESSVSKGSAGSASTVFDYDGSSWFLNLVPSGNEKENIHLSNFIVTGSALGDGGIQVGDADFVINSSIENVEVETFTKTGAAGIKFKNCLLTTLKNVLCRSNYDGFYWTGTNTTITLDGCYSYTNTRYGYNIEQGNSIVFQGNTAAESNDEAGLRIYNATSNAVNYCSFYHYYSEDNCRNATAGSAPIEIDGVSTSPLYINFYGGNILDSVSNKYIDLGRAERILFDYMTLSSYTAGFMEVTANTELVEFRTWSNDASADRITGNQNNAVKLVRPDRLITVANSAETNLNYTGGILFITDQTNDKSAIFALNNASNATELLAGDSSHFANTATASRLAVYYSGGYKVNNQLGAQVDTMVSIKNEYHT